MVKSSDVIRGANLKVSRNCLLIYIEEGLDTFESKQKERANKRNRKIDFGDWGKFENTALPHSQRGPATQDVHPVIECIFV